MNDSPEKRRVDAYLATINRLEPDITPIDQDAALASIAISLKRIADSLESNNRVMQQFAEWGIKTFQ